MLTEVIAVQRRNRTYLIEASGATVGGHLRRSALRDVAFRADNDVKVMDSATGETVFVPPPASELPERLANLCLFANSESSDERFLNPITRAILLHHQLSYDHPFGDGNGRTA